MVDGGDKVAQKDMHLIPGLTGTRHLLLMTMQHTFQEPVAGEPPRDFEQRIQLPHCHNIWVFLSCPRNLRDKF